MGVGEQKTYKVLRAPVPPFISTVSKFGPIGELQAIGSLTAGAAVGANVAYAVPVALPFPVTAVKLWWRNGSSVAGNVDVGIYNSSFALLLSTGAVAQSGTAAVQAVDVTDTVLPAGLYYFALSASSAAMEIQQIVNGQINFTGAVNMTTAHPLPSTLVPTSLGTLVPVMGLSTRTYTG